MAVDYLTENTNRYYKGRYYGQFTVTAGTTSNPVMVPTSASGVPPTLWAYPGASGSLKLQVSGSPVEDIVNGESTVEWQDWALGDVSSDAKDTPLGQIHAVRGIATTSDGKFEVAA